MQNALSVKEITERMAINDIRSHDIFVQPTSALKGEGLSEGLEWLARKVREGPQWQRQKYA